MSVAESIAENSELDVTSYMQLIGQRAVAAASEIAHQETADKNRALEAIADNLQDSCDELLLSNQADMESAREGNLDSALLDRLELNLDRVTSMASGLRQIATLPDPVGAMSATAIQPSGLEIGKMRVPLGVIGIIYESRPNVTADAAALCLKSGNAVILRGGSEAIRSNRAIAACISQGLLSASLATDTVQLINTTDRAAVGHMLTMESHIDVIIPRGGKGLVARISQDAKVPVIKHLDGLCHVYIDKDADVQAAVNIAINSKTYRYGICGAMETLLVHASVAQSVLPEIRQQLDSKEVEIRGCEKTTALLPGIESATDEDWKTEYLGPILSIRIVDTLDEAISHINGYGSAHTDSIVTQKIGTARDFVRRVDSSSVMVNASTCFADGYQYGLGAEIGISTDKLHVRGPVGLEGLTTEKYVVFGDGTTRS